MTECLHCKHCNTTEHPTYKYHVLVTCQLKNIIFQSEAEQPINCHEYVEDRISTRAKYLLTHKMIVVKAMDDEGFLCDEIVWVPESFEMNLVEVNV